MHVYDKTQTYITHKSSLSWGLLFSYFKNYFTFFSPLFSLCLHMNGGRCPPCQYIYTGKCLLIDCKGNICNTNFTVNTSQNNITTPLPLTCLSVYHFNRYGQMCMNLYIYWCFCLHIYFHSFFSQKYMKGVTKTPLSLCVCIWWDQ